MGWLDGDGEGFDVPQGETFTSTVSTGFSGSSFRGSSFSPRGFSVGSTFSGGGDSFTSTIDNTFGGRALGSSSRNISRPDARPDRVVDVVSAFLDRRNAALERLRNPPGFQNVARITWGGPDDGLPINNGDTDTTDSDSGDGGEGFNTKDKDNDGKNNNDKGGPTQWTETKRQIQIMKVASEEDPETYIKVERAVKSLISTGNGELIITWKQPEPRR